MKMTTRLLLCACLALPLAACQKEEAQETVRAPLAAPQTEDRNEWRTYLNDAVGRNMEGIYNQPYVYLVPADDGEEDADAEYERLAERAQTDLARGIVRGNLLAYAGHDSSRVADMVVRAFEGVPEDSMEGVRVLFIGDAVDNPRVEQVVAPAGVEYIFIEK